MTEWKSTVHISTTPKPYPYTYRGGLWVRQKVWGGRGGELLNLPSAKKFWRTLRAKAHCA